MEAITFDCKKCGATLDVPVNAVAVFCSYCQTQHKIAFKDGVLTAELVRKVQLHDERISDLEHHDKHAQKAFDAVVRLNAVRMEIDGLEKSCPECRTKPKQPFVTSMICISCGGLLIGYCVSLASSLPVVGVVIGAAIIVYGYHMQKLLWASYRKRQSLLQETARLQEAVQKRVSS